MENTLIPVIDFCIHNKVEITFIQSLEDYGLVRTKTIEKNVFINIEDLSKLEKFLRLSQDLSINLEGIHAVAHLLEQLYKMEDELIVLKNELNYYKQIQ